MRAETAWLQARYPADLERVPVFTAADPNSALVHDFLRRVQPDLVLARCKFILKPEVLALPRFGTYVLHPGICPEYRNAHGCFWALVNRDLGRVGMTLLRADAGVDTGPIFLQASYPFDERRESPFVVQYRVVLENLGLVAAALESACGATPPPLQVAGRRSAVWGQPRLSAYWRWQRALDRPPEPCKDS
jgi:methionyl-tRNA formyltransferase